MSSGDAGVDLRLVEVGDADSTHAIERLFMEVWRREHPPVSGDILQALLLAGNYVAAAHMENEMVGAAVGFLGHGPGRPLHLHSHIMGVKPGLQVQGVGFALKQHQRRWALAAGLGTVTWTFDPLVRRNAFFNVTKLGATVSGYHVNLYGAMGDGINGDGDSDRLEVDWALESPAAVAAAAGSPSVPDLAAARAAGAVEVLRDVDGAPRTQPLSGDVVLCQVPEDIVAVRRQDPAVARAWRLAVRDTIGAALGQGWTVDGMSRDGWFVLRRG
ncbi:MAG: hypothetical protein QOE92_2552 [Chloroflexota bacterium]|nr:hypothetical protein [Chloroflexota bacterium]